MGLFRRAPSFRRSPALPGWKDWRGAPWQPFGGIAEQDMEHGCRSYWITFERPDVPRAMIGMLFFAVPPPGRGYGWGVRREVRWRIWDGNGGTVWSDFAGCQFRDDLPDLAAANKAAYDAAAASREWHFYLWDGQPGPHCRTGITGLR